MRTLVAILIYFSQFAEGKALASIYNGEQFNLGGILLAQGADQPNDFYIMPTVYQLESGRSYDEKVKLYVDHAGFTHSVKKDEKSGIEYSIYNFKFHLATPSDLEMLVASQQLRMRKEARYGEIKGPAPVCGVDLKIPGFGSAESLSSAPVDPNATFIQYSVHSTGECNTIMDVSEMNVVYRVPMSQEPGVALSLMSESGLTLPNLTLIFPYKYKDTVKLTIDAETAVRQVKSLSGFSGTIKQVTARVGTTMQNLMNHVKFVGKISADCQNRDKTVCNNFLEHAKDILAKTLLIYTAEANKGDTNPLVVADNDKQASVFKIDLAYDEQSAKRKGEFIIDFDNTVYDSIRSQVRFVAKDVELQFFHPSVQKKIQKRER